MRRISYSVELEEVPQEVVRLLDESVNKLVIRDNVEHLCMNRKHY